MIGFKHLIECHCVLRIYKDHDPVIYHKFAVYNKIDDKGKIIPKFANCNNCGLTHYVYEICKSEFKTGKEDLSSVRNINDLKLSLPDKLVKILEEYNCAIDVYELVEDVIDQSFFPYELLIKREIIDDDHHVKVLSILSNDRFKIDSQVIKTTITVKKWAIQLN